MKTIKWLNEILDEFGICFSRTKAFDWFVIIIVAFMIRNDYLGITSVIRVLNLAPSSYECLIHFFHSSAWKLSGIRDKWINIVVNQSPVYEHNTRPVIIGDGIKVDKEARKMPGVKKQHQESDNSSKPEYFFGHLFGSIGILIGNAKSLFCTPVSATIHDGVDVIRTWEDPNYKNNSHVVQMIIDGFAIAKAIGKPVLFLLDRYFLSRTSLERWLELGGNEVMTIITKAKMSCIAYEKPVLKQIKTRGRPSKKGKAIKLKELFKTRKEEFREATVELYGKQQKVKYLSINLLWGLGLYQELQFVLVDLNGAKSILVTTDLNMNPLDVIILYSLRFKIEVTFKQLKQIIKGFSYHFWSKSLPKLNRFISVKQNADKLNKIISLKDRKNIIVTLKAVEGYVMFSCIALGLLQIISLKFEKTINNSGFRWLRTKNSNKPPSEATTREYLSKFIFHMFDKSFQLSKHDFIREQYFDEIANNRQCNQENDSYTL